MEDTVIYADNAATTRISDSVLEHMLTFLCDQYGNASSQHSLGTKAKRAIEQARMQVAAAICAEPSEIIFTSGGSEANNWVLRSVFEAYHTESLHIITSSIEHPSVLTACRVLEHNGVEVTYLPVDVNGNISVDDVKAAIKSNTRLVSIMLANNEIGTIQPIVDVSRLLLERNILFHTDAVQAVGHIPVDVNELHVDFLTASAHKFNGAKGTGILYKNSRSDLSPMIFGGEQEGGFRAGTENVASIVAAGYAIEESIAVMNDTTNKLNAMVDATVKGIRARIPTMQVYGNSENSLPGLVNILFAGISGESLMHLLNLKEICVSTSSACTSGHDGPSHVLIALGLTEQQAQSAIRISYGRYNSVDDTESVVSAICDAYGKIKANLP